MSISDTCQDQPLAAEAPRSALLEEAGAILRLAGPIMLIALVNMGMSITDTLMVSRLLEAEALAAVAVGSDLYSILFYLGAGVLGGLAPFYTAAVVRTDPTERARLERIGQLAAALLALLFVPAVWTAPDWLRALGLDPVLLEEARGYTRAMALTLVLMLGVALYRPDRGREAARLPQGDACHAAAERRCELCPDDWHGTVSHARTVRRRGSPRSSSRQRASRCLRPSPAGSERVRRPHASTGAALPPSCGSVCP